MALSQDEVRAHAERLIQHHNDMYEFSDVYDDVDLAEAEVEYLDLERIHNAMYAAKITVTWED